MVRQEQSLMVPQTRLTPSTGLYFPVLVGDLRGLLEHLAGRVLTLFHCSFRFRSDVGLEPVPGVECSGVECPGLDPGSMPPGFLAGTVVQTEQSGLLVLTLLLEFCKAATVAFSPQTSSARAFTFRKSERR